jgi:hypothetical protein
MRQMPPDGNESRKNCPCMRGSIPSRCTSPGLGYLIVSRKQTVAIHGPGRRLIPATAMAIDIAMKRRLTCLSFFPDKTRGVPKNSLRPMKIWIVSMLRNRELDGCPSPRLPRRSTWAENEGDLDFLQAPFRNGSFTCGGQAPAFPRQGPAWGRESCWREDSCTSVPKGAHAAVGWQKPIHSFHSIPSRSWKSR